MAIGNTVFQDYNRNGNQDAGEPGINNIPVRLFQSGVERGQTVTSNGGQFLFTNANVPVGIRPNTAYEIRIAAADFPTGLNLTRPGTATPGNNAQLIGNNAVVFLTTDASGNPPTTYGIGFAAGNPDLAITTSATSSTVAKGGTATFTIQTNNTGSGTATSVVVSTTLDPGLTYLSSSPTATTITTEGGSTVLRWSLNTLTAGAPQSTFGVTATADLEGVLYNTASITTPDTESNPTNNISRACVSVPIKLCPGDQYVASVSAEFTNVQWFRNGSSTPIASGNSLTIVQSGSYSFTTTANTSCPASGCCPVIVEDGILPNLAITPANPAICAGTTTSLTATGCTSASLVWSTGATSVSIPVSPTATTVYSVTCNSTTYGTCTVSVSTTVTVNPSVTATLSSATICNGTVASLTATGAGVGGSYVLSPGGLLSSTGSFTVSPSITTAYSVSVTDANGCSGTATGSVTVNPSVTATLSSATICNGTVASLTATGAGVGGSYVLSPGGLLSSTGSFTVSPSLTTPYSVSVTDANGCSGTATGTVTVNPSVTATLSSATICNGTVASLTATGAGTGGSYVLSPGGLLSSTGSFTVSPSVTTAYSVSVTDANGCSGTATGSVTVNPSVTATLSSATICDGTTASLTATGGTSYTLNPGGLVSATGSFTVSPSVTTAYSVSVTDANGCSGTATGSVTVNPSVTATLSSATICNGTVASLTATGGTSYTLSPGGLISSTGSFTVSPSELTAYSVVVTNASGCSGTATGTVTVNPSVTATLSSATICNGTVASLTATGAGVGGSYVLSPGGLLSSTGSFTVSPSVTTAYSVSVTDANGCSGTATGTVTVNPSVTATLSSATICDGSVASLTATGGTSYTLSPGGLLSSTGSFTVSPSLTTVYSVSVTDANGCSGTATGSVTVNPSVTATLSSATICNGTVASLTAGGAGTGGSYVLSPGGLLSSTGSFTVSPSVTTAYSVSVTDANGCSGTATGTVTVNPSVTATLTVSSATVCQGTSATLTAGGGTVFLWSTGETTSAISVTVSGTYSVTVSNAQSCSDIISTTITVNPTPVLTVNSPTVCAGQSSVLSITGCLGTLTWSTGDQTTSLTVVPLITTSYSATCVLTTGCSSTVSSTVTVNAVPTYDANVVVVAATCTGAAANPDASITLTNVAGAVSAGISVGSTYAGPTPGAVPIGDGTVRFGGLSNPDSPAVPQPYTIRLFAASGCFTDVTVILDPVICQCPAPVCVPIVIQKIMR